MISSNGSLLLQVVSPSGFATVFARLREVEGRLEQLDLLNGLLRVGSGGGGGEEEAMTCWKEKAVK